MKETDLGPPIAAWFAMWGWETWNEVELYDRGHVTGGTLDMLATQGNIASAIELKTQLSWTTYKAACKALADVARAAPGIPLADAVKKMDHRHYSGPKAARAALTKWLRCDRVEGVRAEYSDTGRILLYAVKP